MTKKPHPWAKCMKCGAFHSDDFINKGCPKCGGAVKSELRPNTWFECQVCDGTGGKNDAPCRSCDGNGWLFIDLFKM